VIPALTCGAVSQISESPSKVDAYYKVTTELGIWIQAKETYEASDPVTVEFRPPASISSPSSPRFGRKTS
jgi:hypothetical protein